MIHFPLLKQYANWNNIKETKETFGQLKHKNSLYPIKRMSDNSN